MNNSLERLIEGIITTLRTDVIPNVTNAYGRGQAIGVIDLLNNIAPRLEWERGPILAAIAERRAVISEVRALLPGAPHTSADGAANADLSFLSSNALLAARDRLDAEIADLVVFAYGGQAKGDPAEARARLRAHMHDALALEMKLTKKPLFAEIAKATAAGGISDSPASSQP